MILTAVFFALMCVGISNAHTYLSALVINGNAQAEGDCIRPLPSSNYNFPISSVTSPDMTCGFLPSASQPANRKCPVAAGSTVGVQWHYELPGSSDNYIIDPSHKGPCMVYLAKSDTGSGAVWFKIFEDGYDATTQKWCVEKLIANRGLLNVKIPSDIAPGNYLLRGEIIALHGAYAQGGAQPYVHCAEITISGSGSSTPSSEYLVSLPGAYSPNDPGILLSIYQGITRYTIPGPKVYSGSSNSGSSNSGSASSTTAKSATTGRTATTGRVATTGKVSATTGRVSATTGRVSASTSSSSGTVSSTECSTVGYMKCATSETYQTCVPLHGGGFAWGQPQRCQTGAKCDT